MIRLLAEVKQMSQLKTLAAQTFDTVRLVRAVFDELDLLQLSIFARHPPTRRLEMMFDLCEFSRRLIIASERQRQPDMTDDELARRVRARIELAYDI